MWRRGHKERSALDYKEVKGIRSGVLWTTRRSRTNRPSNEEDAGEHSGDKQSGAKFIMKYNNLENIRGTVKKIGNEVRSCLHHDPCRATQS